MSVEAVVLQVYASVETGLLSSKAANKRLFMREAHLS